MEEPSSVWIIVLSREDILEPSFWKLHGRNSIPQALSTLWYWHWVCRSCPLPRIRYLELGSAEGSIIDIVCKVDFKRRALLMYIAWKTSPFYTFVWPPSITIKEHDDMHWHTAASSMYLSMDSYTYIHICFVFLCGDICASIDSRTQRVGVKWISSGIIWWLFGVDALFSDSQRCSCVLLIHRRLSWGSNPGKENLDCAFATFPWARMWILPPSPTVAPVYIRYEQLIHSLYKMYTFVIRNVYIHCKK